jgi:hypothetical protein
MISRAISFYIDIIVMSLVLYGCNYVYTDSADFIFILISAYFIICYISLGKTLGYVLVGYQVDIVTESSRGGKRLRYIFRACLKAISIVFIFPLIPFFKHKLGRRSVVDLICGTVVRASGMLDGEAECEMGRGRAIGSNAKYKDPI